MRLKTVPLLAFLAFTLISFQAQARSSKNITVGIMGLGNIQLLETLPNLDPGPGGGFYFDYRFNQRFSLTVDGWVSSHDGTGSSNGDDGILLLGIPTGTLKLYLLDDESSKWDPYAGIGIGLYSMTEGSVSNSTSGVGLGAQVDLGFDYYFSDTFSAGFSGVFRSAGIINSLGSGSNATAIIPFSLMGRFGYHF